MVGRLFKKRVHEQSCTYEDIQTYSIDTVEEEHALKQTVVAPTKASIRQLFPDSNIIFSYRIHL